MKRLGRAVAVITLTAAGALGQTADTLLLRARLVSGETAQSVGTADVRISAVRGTDATIVSGTVSYRLTLADDDVLYTAASLVRNSGGLALELNPIPFTGRVQGVVLRQRHVDGSDPNDLAALGELASNPAAFSLRIATLDRPEGTAAGGLERVQRAVSLANLNQAGAVSIDMVATRDGKGTVTSARVTTAVNYRVAAADSLTRVLLTAGTDSVDLLAAAGASAPVDLDPSGTGAVVISADLDMGQESQAMLAYRLLSSSPAQLTLGLTSGAELSAALRRAARSDFALTTGLSGQPAAIAKVTLFSALNANGEVSAFVMETDCNYRLPGGASLSSLLIRDSSDGTVAWTTGFAQGGELQSDSGFGNFHGLEPPKGLPSALGGLMLANGQRFRWELAVTANGSAATVQTALAEGALAPVVSRVVSAAGWAPAIGAGSSISILGQSFAPSVSTLDGWDAPSLPRSLSGVTVEMGSQTLPLVFVTPGEVRAQVPVDLAQGVYPLHLQNAGGGSNEVAVRVDALAPAIFTADRDAFVLHAADYSLLTVDNPAAAGETVLIYATGLGPTNPPLATGTLGPVDAPPPVVAVVHVFLSDKEISVRRAVAAEGFAGVYKIEATIPAGLSGRQPLVVAAGDIRSAPVETSLR
ncbi:MAG: hypothetical protein ABI693_15560 [Bryobacteraceae bacterium]